MPHFSSATPSFLSSLLSLNTFHIVELGISFDNNLLLPPSSSFVMEFGIPSVNHLSFLPYLSPLPLISSLSYNQRQASIVRPNPSNSNMRGWWWQMSSSTAVVAVARRRCRSVGRTTFYHRDENDDGNCNYSFFDGSDYYNVSATDCCRRRTSCSISYCSSNTTIIIIIFDVVYFLHSTKTCVTTISVIET